MLHPEIDSERGATQEIGEQEHLVVTLSLGIAELNANTNKDFYINLTAENTDEPRFFRVGAEFKPMFAVQAWHRFYAGALLETDMVRLSLFIVLAEDAILDRYIELIADLMEPEEIVDLQTAVVVLSQLRETNQLGYMATNFIA
jgi:hypothetical protein